MVSVKEWLVLVVKKYWQGEEQRVEKKFLYHQNLDIKNDYKKSNISRCYSFKSDTFFYIKQILKL